MDDYKTIESHIKSSGRMSAVADPTFHRLSLSQILQVAEPSQNGSKSDNNLRMPMGIPSDPPLSQASNTLPACPSCVSAVRNGDQGGQLGVFWITEDASKIEFIRGHVFHQFIDPRLIHLIRPAGNASMLYAPTTHFPAQCFEVGENYSASKLTKELSVVLYAYDFCRSPGTFYNLDVPKDAVVRAVYPDGSIRPTISWYVYTDGIDQLTSSEHVAYLDANEKATQLVDRDGKPLSEPVSYMFDHAHNSRTDGWSIFETHFFQAGLCPLIPAIQSDNMQYDVLDKASLLSQRKQVSYLAQGTVLVNPQAGQDCVKDDDKGQGFYYVVSPLGNAANNAGWEVTSHASQ